MNILGKELSEKTASLIKEITQCLSKPVEYRFTDPSKTSSYGQCDAWQPDAYYIYCKESLLSAALMLMFLKLAADPISVNQLLQLYLPKNQSLVVCCLSAAEAISQVGYNDPESAFGSLACLFGTFNLFSTHSIIFRGKEYTDFASAEMDYPGTRIVFPPTAASGG